MNITSRRRINRRYVRRSPKRKSVRRKSRKQSKRKSVRRKSRKQSKRKSVRRKSRKQSKRKSVRRKSRKQSKRKSVRRKSRKQSKRKSVRRKSRKQSKRKFGFSSSPHYLCVLNKNGSYKCNKYPDRNTCESYGAKCTSNKSQCVNKCEKFSKKFMENIPGYKCDPLKKACIKYNTLKKCMSSLTNIENKAGIRCSTDLNDCKDKCRNLMSKMKGKTGPMKSNKTTLDRQKTIRGGNEVFRELRNKHARKETIRDSKQVFNEPNKQPIRKEKMD
jgi:hypothetical protein